MIILALASTAAAASRMPTEVELCAMADQVVVAMVGRVEPSTAGSGAASSSSAASQTGLLAGLATKYARVTLKVEQLVNGAEFAEMTFTAFAGFVGPTGLTQTAEARQWLPGERELFFLVRTAPGKTLGADLNPWVLYHSFPIDADGALPPLDVTRAIFREHCSTRKGVQPVKTRPTEAYLPDLPASLLGWCAHY